MNEEKSTFEVLSGLPGIKVLEFETNTHGEVKLDVSEILGFSTYEEEMRRQPSILFYVERLRLEVTSEVAYCKGLFEEWKSSQRGRAIEIAMVEFQKAKPTISDIDAVLASMELHKQFERDISEKEVIAESLGALVRALNHKKSMLEQLAQYERMNISSYSFKE